MWQQGTIRKDVWKKLSGGRINEHRKASAIFKDIHNEETEVEDKITAIQEVIDMPTHNSITKKSMLEVLHWLIEEYI